MFIRPAFGIIIGMVLTISIGHACTLNIFAASSLTDVVDDILEAYNEIDDAGEACGIYASSSALARQIEFGAPAHVFLSANKDWVDYLNSVNGVDHHHVKPIATNRLVLAGPENSTLAVDFSDTIAAAKILHNKLIGIGEINTVPAGIYGAEALNRLGLWDIVKPTLIYGDNVRSVTTWLSRNEIDGGIIYQSDLKAYPKLHLAGTFPESSHEPILYYAALVSNQLNPEAQLFYAYLSDGLVEDLFVEHGFSPLVSQE